MNPYRLGFIGSTDTHNGTPGDVEEWNWEGSTGLADVSPEKRLKPRIQRNPGGLVGIWAEENSRDALFDAISSEAETTQERAWSSPIWYLPGANPEG